jgi:hypothetical protein
MEILKNPIVLVSKIMRNRGIISGIALLIFLGACLQPEPAKNEVSKLEKEKISGAVSCTATGLPVQDRSASNHVGFRCVKISS